FDRWKAAKKHSSDRAALAALGVSHGAAVHWKAGRNADADVIERMANDLGENAGALIAQAMAESAKGDAARTWARLAKQLGAAAAVAAVAVVALPYITANEAGDASALAMCIMRSVAVAGALILTGRTMVAASFHSASRGIRNRASLLPL